MAAHRVNHGFWLPDWCGPGFYLRFIKKIWWKCKAFVFRRTANLRDNNRFRACSCSAQRSNVVMLSFWLKNAHGGRRIGVIGLSGRTQGSLVVQPITSWMSAVIPVGKTATLTFIQSILTASAYGLCPEEIQITDKLSVIHLVLLVKTTGIHSVISAMLRGLICWHDPYFVVCDFPIMALNFWFLSL